MVGVGILQNIGSLLWDTGRKVRDLSAGALAPLVAASEWRRRRLLILGYHGIALEDEHIWDGTLYMSPQMFRRRLFLLRKANCSVLPMDEALRRLGDGSLPPRAVVLTFDDGFFDFASVVAPMLAEFGYPATNFVSSYYAEFNRPIFDIMLRYLLWKGALKTLHFPGVLETSVKLDLRGQEAAREQIRKFSFETGLSGLDKDNLLRRLAGALGIDYGELCRKRLLHSMNAGEVRQMHLAGHDVQLHTHRHRVSRKRDLFEREIQDNRKWIGEAIGNNPRLHFSYPGNVWQPVQRDWLVALGIVSASTASPALAEATTDRLLLPRVVDNSNVSERVFGSWTAGSMQFFPKRSASSVEGQIIEDTIKPKPKKLAATL